MHYAQFVGLGLIERPGGSSARWSPGLRFVTPVALISKIWPGLLVSTTIRFVNCSTGWLNGLEWRFPSCEHPAFAISSSSVLSSFCGPGAHKKRKSACHSPDA